MTLNIYSIIICYKPDSAKLRQTCQLLISSNSKVIIVDNTPGGSDVDEHTSLLECKLISLRENTGIAHAQNIGIRAARQSGADVIVFFDQDSTITPGFLTALISPLERGKARIVAPVYFDEMTRTQLPSTRLNRWGLPVPVYQTSDGTSCLVDIVMSSGTAASYEVFEIAGLLDEEFFIDFVDTEWCLRCRSKGIPIQIIPAAVMKHTIGLKSIALGKFTVLVHSPIRCYYQVRNCFLLFRKPHIPLLFAIRETFTVWLSRLLLLAFAQDKFAYLRIFIQAIRDGAIGVTRVKPSE